MGTSTVEAVGEEAVKSVSNERGDLVEVIFETPPTSELERT